MMEDGTTFVVTGDIQATGRTAVFNYDFQCAVRAFSSDTGVFGEFVSRLLRENKL